MSAASQLALCAIALASAVPLVAQSATVTPPKTVAAGSAFAIETSGSGRATLFIVGPGQFIKRDIQLGEAASFPAETLYNAGRYVVALSGAASVASQFDVVPAADPKTLSFLARPSRLPVGLHDGITGAVYVFDAFQNLIMSPVQVSFELTSPSGAEQKRAVTTQYGAAWTALDSSAAQGADKFVARAGEISSTRVIGQVPGDPCTLKMTAKPSNGQIALETDPVRDCSGNAVPDGTIVTFTETWSDDRSTVDVPLKRGVAKAEMPAHPGATITVASGVTLGNQIHWER